MSSAWVFLPRPMAIIFSSPLSMGPVKSVCFFTRLTTTMPSASQASRSTCTGIPSGV